MFPPPLNRRSLSTDVGGQLISFLAMSLRSGNFNRAVCHQANISGLGSSLCFFECKGRQVYKSISLRYARTRLCLGDKFREAVDAMGFC